MDTAHRRELKHDKFVDQVGHSVEYAAAHRDQVIKYGIAAVVVLLLGVGVYWYLNHQRDVRQSELRGAMGAFEAGIGQGGEFLRSFANQADKDKAVVKELGDVVTAITERNAELASRLCAEHVRRASVTALRSLREAESE